MKKIIWLAGVAMASLLVVTAQQTKIEGTVVQQEGQIPVIAVPELKGSGDAQRVMAAFNQTLWSDLETSGVLKMAPRTMYPLNPPQQQSDLTARPPAPERIRRGDPPPPTSGGGRWLTDWSGPPVNAKYLAFGYGAVQNGVFVALGWLDDVSRDTPANAQMIAKRYAASPDEAGARKAAHDFAADILALFGGQTLAGTHIYFVSRRTGHEEIWAMDFDGKNQRQITHYNSISIEPSVSPDGSKIAFTSFVRITPGIFVFSVDPPRELRFYNQSASVNSSPSFTPDGQHIVYSSSAGGCCRIFIANLDGSGFRPISSLHSIDTEPKINPKTGNEIVFSSGRSGAEQIYRMNMDGADMERLTDGTGEAGNPSWNPDGRAIAYAWTRGYAAGAWNIFIMEVASRNYVQLTHGDGKNEHPSWAPDGKHLVFSKKRGREAQIWTMLADGSQAQQLTTIGNNDRPVWGK